MYSDARRVPLRPMRVMLVDDHVYLRQGLKALLEAEPGIRVVAEAGTVPDALRHIEASKPCVVVADIGLADHSGIELIVALRARRNSIPVLVLTIQQGQQWLRDAMQAGASGYVLKNAPHAELLEGLQAVCAGKKFFCDTLSMRILSGYAAPPGELQRAPVHLITRREREVLTRVALGQSNKMVARDLSLSVKTVEKHRSNLMRKLNLHNAASVTMFALRHGLVKRDAAKSN